MAAGTLKAAGWEHLARNFPDSEVVVALLGICQYGARIGYESVRSAVTIHSNLTTANDDPALVTAEIISEIERGRLEVYPNRASLPNNYTASPIGLTDKSDGSKRRIHHLSYPAGDSSSINDGIPPEYGVIKYSNIDDAILAIQTLGRDCILVKRDFESAFRHIPVSPLDTPLIGFHWAGEYYAERFLPFGLRTAPYIFNLFAEVFHWILEDKLHHANPNITIIHYLDDFLMVLPRTGNLESCTETFERLCFEVGLSIKECKNEQGTLACFGGIELDTAKMVIRLPEKKLHKARKIIKQAVAWKSVSLLDLQKITGYFNFISTVIPLGRTFLRRLYNMEAYFPPGSSHSKRRLSREAQKDLAWWSQVLRHSPERSITLKKREVILAWSDASSTKGLGAFYLSGTEMTPRPEAAFAISIPGYLAKVHEHINTQEMRAVEQVLLYWGRQWKGKRLIIHTDNRAVAHALANRSIRGAPMQVLRRTLLLAADYDLELEAIWISTKDNTLADALSRMDWDRIANLAPQLISPSCNLRKLGFLTSSNRDSLQAPHTISGVALHPQQEETTTHQGLASQPSAL